MKVAALAALGAAASLLAGCGSSAPKKASPPPPVIVTIARSQQIPLTREFTGRLSAYREANVLARVPGVLLKRWYREGSEVNAGQALFEIDPAP